MTKISKIVEQVNKEAQASEVLEQSKDRYRDKTFTEEYLPLYNVVKKAFVVPSVISCASSSMVALMLLGSISPALAIFIGLLIVCALEVAKLEISSIAMKSLFTKNKAAGLLLIMTALYGVSIFLSVYGSYNAYNELGAFKEGSIKESSLNSLDSVKSVYNGMINEAVQTASDFKNSSSWKGKLSIKNQERYFGLLSKVDAIKAEQKAAIAELNAVKDSELKESESNTRPYLFIFIGFSLIVELSIFLMARFKEYYQFKVANEHNVLSSRDSFNVSLDSLQSLINTFGNSFAGANVALQGASKLLQSANGVSVDSLNEGTSKPLQSTPTPNKIGFEFGTETDEVGTETDEAGTETDEAGTELNEVTARYLKKHHKVVDCILQNKSRKEAMEAGNVKHSTYYNIKRCMLTAKMIE